ncbi:MAG: tyrosine-type recombinase/integrase, partial [Planctomycetota bacterium]
LESASSVRDTLLIGLMYATGMRVSEVVRVRFEDLDFDRNTIRIRQSKGRSDRLVTLPTSFRALLATIAEGSRGGFLFPAQPGSTGGGKREEGRYLSARTVQRVLERACTLGKLRQRITPHMLRHAFATHSFEDGFDIRRIQKVLGHLHLETTTIYVRVADPIVSGLVASPADRLLGTSGLGVANAASSELAVGNRKGSLSKGTQSTVRCGEPISDERRHCAPKPRKNDRRKVASGMCNRAGGAGDVGTSPSRLGDSVGRFRLEWGELSKDGRDGAGKAVVSLVISAGEVVVEIGGIRVTNERLAGWLKIEFPPGERMAESLQCLPDNVRERVESWEFMQMVEKQICREYAPRLEEIRTQQLAPC